jgi:transposase
VKETGKPIPEVAEDLVIHPGTLHRWVSRARRNGSLSSDRPVAEPSGGRLRESERAELERLRAEAGEKDKRIHELEMERDVCKQGAPPAADRTGEARRQHLAEEIEEIFRGSGDTYGSPKVFIELVRRGWRVSVNAVAKLMADLGQAGRKVKRRRSLSRPGRRRSVLPSAARLRDGPRHDAELVVASLNA